MRSSKNNLTPVFVFFNLCKAVFTIELLNSTTGSGSLLLTCIKRMALGADFNVNITLCGTRLKCVTAVACNVRYYVFRLDILFHDYSPFNAGSEIWLRTSVYKPIAR